MGFNAKAELDRVRALKVVYEDAIAAINLKLQSAPRDRRLSLSRLKAQHEASVATLTRQESLYAERVKNELRVIPAQISDNERAHALETDSKRRSIQHECQYCRRWSLSFQFCAECLDTFAQENQNAR